MGSASSILLRVFDVAYKQDFPRSRRPFSESCKHACTVAQRPQVWSGLTGGPSIVADLRWLLRPQ